MPRGIPAERPARQARLLRVLQVVHERGLPRPSYALIARLAGYRGPQGAHNNIVRLLARGEIPSEWWPPQRRRASV